MKVKENKIDDGDEIEDRDEEGKRGRGLNEGLKTKGIRLKRKRKTTEQRTRPRQTRGRRRGQ